MSHRVIMIRLNDFQNTFRHDVTAYIKSRYKKKKKKKWKEIGMLIRIQLEKTDNTYYYCNSVERESR